MEFISNRQILKTEFGFQFEHSLNDKEYIVQIVYPKTTDNYNIPYILVIPKHIKEDCMLAVEVNNFENEDENNLRNNALITARDLTAKLKDNYNPVLIPIIPSVNGGIPYYQQLSKECFDIPTDSSLYRIDLQVLNIIQDAKERISKYTNISEKVFLNGYSASGVFAQRFVLLHPEIVDTLCVGGATSIDRVYRRFVQDGNLLKYKKYHPHETEEQVYKNAPRCVWEDEGAIYCPEILDKIKSDGKDINYICTHTTPQIAPPITKGNNLQYWFNQDTTLVEDLDNERRTMTQIYDKLVADEHPIIAWCYGHFHFHEHTFINTHKFILIDMCRNGIMDIVQVTPF